MYDVQSIEALEIGSCAQASHLDPDAEAAAVAGCLAAMDSSVSEQHRKDVLESLLLAQLAATATTDRQSDPANWYRTYQRTLEGVGWVTAATTAMTRFIPTSTPRYSIADVVTDLFKRKLVGDELGLVSSTLEAYRGEANGRAQQVFECPSHGGGVGNFQVVLAVEDVESVKMHIGRFTFTSPAYVGKLATQQFASDTRFHSGHVFSVLNEDFYAGVRSAVSEKLGDRFAASVALLSVTPGAP